MYKPGLGSGIFLLSPFLLPQLSSRYVIRPLFGEMRGGLAHKAGKDRGIIITLLLDFLLYIGPGRVLQRRFNFKPSPEFLLILKQDISIKCTEIDLLFNHRPFRCLRWIKKVRYPGSFHPGAGKNIFQLNMF